MGAGVRQRSWERVLLKEKSCSYLGHWKKSACRRMKQMVSFCLMDFNQIVHL